MKTHSTPTILVLGAQGLVGRMVYSYLARTFPGKVFGTSRQKNTHSDFLYFSVETAEIDFSFILNKLPALTYIINCIGITKSDSVSPETVLLVNGTFPKAFEKKLLPPDCKFIHISSDAVFTKDAGMVSENSQTSPDDAYGKSKLRGEVTGENSLTIRTSFLGFDPHKKSGLLEWVRNNPVPTLAGFTNQKWAGCTALQFAQLCEYLIQSSDHFLQFQKASSVIHFCPLRATKYQIVLTTVQVLQLPKKVQKTLGIPISRELTSHYLQASLQQLFTNNLKVALANLRNF